MASDPSTPRTTITSSRSLLESPLGRLRAVALIEGASFLLLLGVAMPLKYLAGLPLAVKLVGWAHGVLFVLFCVALAHAALAARWRLLRVALVFVSALVPFGTFAIDPSLRRELESR